MSNYRAVAKTSKATAARDLTALVAGGFLVQGEAGGRSTRYRLAPTLVTPQ